MEKYSPLHAQHGRVVCKSVRGASVCLFLLCVRGCDAASQNPHATYYNADHYVFIVLHQGGERVGGWNPWALTQCCALRPPEAGRGTTAHQKLEVDTRLCGIMVSRQLRCMIVVPAVG